MYVFWVWTTKLVKYMHRFSWLHILELNLSNLSSWYAQQWCGWWKPSIFWTKWNRRIRLGDAYTSPAMSFIVSNTTVTAATDHPSLPNKTVHVSFWECNKSVSIFLFVFAWKQEGVKFWTAPFIHDCMITVYHLEEWVHIPIGTTQSGKGKRKKMWKLSLSVIQYFSHESTKQYTFASWTERKKIQWIDGPHFPIVASPPLLAFAVHVANLFIFVLSTHNSHCCFPLSARLAAGSFLLLVPLLLSHRPSACEHLQLERT